MSDHLIESKQVGRFKIEISQDELDVNPRTEWDNLGHIVYTSSRYILGDERVTAERIQEIENDKTLFSVPFYAHIHSGITVSLGSFSCKWDSGQAGIIYVEKEKILKEFNFKKWDQAAKNKALLVFKGEIEIFDKYLTGQVYYYHIKDVETGEIIDSCGGCFEDPSEIIKENFDSRVKNLLSREAAQLAMIETCKDNFIHSQSIDSLKLIAENGFTAFDKRDYSQLETYIKENLLENKLAKQLERCKTEVRN